MSPAKRLVGRAALAVAAAALALFALVAAAEAPDAAEARSAWTGAVPVELREDQGSADVYGHAFYYVERRGATPSMTLDFSPDPAQFSPLVDSSSLAMPASSEALWLAFTVRSAASARSWILSAGPGSVENISVYLVDPDGRAETRFAGFNEPSARKNRALSDYLFRLTMAPGDLKTIYIRFSSVGGGKARAAVWDAFEFLRYDSYATGFASLLLGVVLALFSYTLFVVVSIRDRSFVYYLVFLFGLFWYVVASDGAGAALVWPGRLFVERAAMPIFASLMISGGLLFSRSFLGAKERFPRIDLCMATVAGASPVLLVVVSLFGPGYARLGATHLLVLSEVIVVAAALVAGRGGQRRAWYLAAAWALALAGSAANLLTPRLFLDPYAALLWSKSAQAGALLQVLVLAFGISDSLNRIKEEKEESQRREIESLERANRVKEDFLVGTGLEFGAPLYGIIGLGARLESLLAGLDSPEASRLLALVKAEALRLLNQVQGIDAYARLRNGDLALVAERFPLEEAVAGVASAAAYLGSGKDLATSVECPAGEIVSDIKVLQQILYTLYSTAIKRSSAGRVSLEVSLAGGDALFTVTDSAPPLPPEALERVRSPDADGPEAIGPGLEFLVARRLAELLGGGLSYEHAGPGGRFILRVARRAPFVGKLPSSERRREREPGLGFGRFDRGPKADARQALADLSESSPGSGVRGSVLAVSEDPVYLVTVKAYLEARGYALKPLVSAEEAALLVESGRVFDLVLLDASDPAMRGLEACARMRRARPLGELPILVMTDRERPEAAAAALGAGADDYLPRLSPPELLYARVDTRVALKRAIEEGIETRRRVADLDKLKTLGVLAAGLAHEINTPNNAVLRNIPLLSEVWREIAPIIARYRAEYGDFNLRGWDSEELLKEIPELLSDTYDAGRQIKKIVEDLKDYSREPGGGGPEGVDLGEVAAYARRLLGPLVERSTKRFSLDCRPGLPLVLADYRKLTQVAVNIVENALQSLPDPEASVRVRIFHEAAGDPAGDSPDDPAGGDARRAAPVAPSVARPRVVFECRDEGRGIDPEVAHRVFEPFFTTKRDSGGSGLGLPVSLGIVREWGGDIDLRPAEGGGTVVSVVFPAAPADGAPPARPGGDQGKELR
ncbi:MAG: response regulator [Spirochaetaceae bacterium]|nr:response regulator [Spirochaetaceae bacterium]